ncbi:MULTISPECIES: helix-turn-helix domain-containing protein [unclassified Chitinophaga]|uniref:helix-turn-helix domain-containing protein n=1 Tax=unclassified Chitinophaga TaxID=2619133 RepID=UPI0015C2EEA5|nr:MULTISPECIES: helix-turn-helix domain-containing protein [unclassified Chitinophaga]WPV66157.1 helix-turn-helix domain-containing protein [Chitinophaga sp. LS1]
MRESIPVYSLGTFGPDSNDFRIDRLSFLLQQYPFLEHLYRPSYYMLICIWEAVGWVTIDNEKINAEGPKVIFVKPNNICCLDLSNLATGFIVCFTDNFFSLRYNNNVLHRFAFMTQHASITTRISHEQTNKWDNLLQQILDEFENMLEGKNDLLRSYLNILLHELDRTIFKLPVKEEKNIKHAKIIRFEQLVEDNYAHHRHPSFYADQLHITTNYLNKLCHEFYHITSGSLIRARIVKEASRLLHHTSQSVAEIAYELGFESASYFNTFYKKETGMTPENFRKSKTFKS